MKRRFISARTFLSFRRPSCILMVSTLGLAAEYPQLAAADNSSKPSITATARAAAVEQYNLAADKLALQGYDPVAYFTENRAVKGSAEYLGNYRGVAYRFASDANRKRFQESPEKYLPTYGGWCATAMAKGEKVEIDPTNFKVTDNRLFLFYKGLWGNARKDWEKDEANETRKADAHWKKISGE
ncbi:MAG TPA: YHS domain-containing (seleno)protein [Candidatus Limnocylindria bacterium]|nr:YHS domain-containing (seleno)protein [Candidatus Limnocylindria bacterium]